MASPVAKRPKLSNALPTRDRSSEQDLVVAPNSGPLICAPPDVTAAITYTFTLNVVACGFCKELLVGHIFQCRNHHIVCAQCHSKEKNWCSCPSPVDSFRNEALERMVGCFSIDCSNASLGCSVTFPITAKRAHELKCAFAPRQCPRCDFKGPATNFSSHFAECHRWNTIEVTDYNVEFGMVLKTREKESRIVPVRVASSKALFLIHVEVHGSSIHLFPSQVARFPVEDVRIRLGVWHRESDLSLRTRPRSISKANESGPFLAVPECFYPDGRIHLESSIRKRA